MNVFQVQFFITCKMTNNANNATQQRYSLREAKWSGIFCGGGESGEGRKNLYGALDFELQEKTREFQTQVLHYFSKNNNKSNHQSLKNLEYQENQFFL